MKILYPFSPFYFYLIAFLWHSSLIGSATFSNGPELSNATEAELTSASTVSCYTPTWPVTSNITQTSATFSWDAVYGAQTYSVQSRIPNGTWYNVPGSPTASTSITVSWFLPNTTYEWRVRANCYNGEYSYYTAPVTFTTLGSSCEHPTWLYTSNITQTSAKLNWDAVYGAENYSIQLRETGGYWYDLPGGPFYGTWYTINGLDPGTCYEWRIRSNCANWSYSSWSYPESFCTLGYSCTVPTWPVTSNITHTSASLSWDEVWGAVNYSVQIRLTNGSWWDVPGSPTYNTWINVSGLEDCTSYQWRVKANCGGGNSSYWTKPKSFTTLCEYSCDYPAWLYTSNITQTTATLNWNSVPGATSYTIQLRESNGNWYNIPGNPFYGTWTTLWDLDPGSCYTWRIKSNCSNWESSDWTWPEPFCTLGYSCSAPTWPTSSNITTTSATLSWDPVAGANSYTVQISLPNGSWWDLPGSPTYNTWISATGLEPCTTYHWRVRANCGSGSYSYWSTYVLFTTQCTSSCEAPNWLYTTNITQTSAKLSWETVYGALSYSIQLRESNGYWYDLPGGPFTGTWYNVYGLEPGTCYEWRIRSNCYNWSYSEWSYPESFCTLGYSCSTPTWPASYNITQTTATLSWDIVYGAYDYNVQIRLPNGSWWDVPGSPTYATWIYVTGLEPCTTYQWRVRANCGNGNYSYWTKPKSFTTLCITYCQAPTWLTTTDITESSAKLKWEAVNGAINYSIQWREVGGVWQYLPGGPFNNPWITIYGLHPGTSYEWRVQTHCADWTSSSWSHSAYFTTPGYVCSLPTWYFTNNITTNSATLNWNVVPGAQSYSVQLLGPNGQWQEVLGSPFTGNTATVTGLTPGTTYQWRVRTNCTNGGYSYWSQPLVFTTLITPGCSAPYSLITDQITETSAHLDWSPVPEALSYDLQIRILGGDWEFVQGGPWIETEHVITGLLSDTTYDWRVRSKCDAGLFSEWSNHTTFTTLNLVCAVPSGTTTTNITDTSVTVSWNAVPGALSYTVEMKVSNGPWTEVSGSPFTGTTNVIDSLLPATSYAWRVRSNCGGGEQSGWSSQLGFTTTGTPSSGSDECETATVLTVNSSCVNSAASNVGATESSPEPQGWCPENEYNDVWFRFTMPDVPNPVVTIRTTAGSLTDAIMEVYRGGGCADLEYIICEDDNYTGNGSTMPVISVTGNPNETIWVRIWGYAGTTGTFNICVFDYQSNDFAAPDDTPDVFFDGEALDPLNVAEPVFKETSATLRVSPNPTRDVLNVTLAQTDKTKVTRIVLMDLTGKIVYRKDYPANDLGQFTDQLDVSGFTPEMYLLHVITTSGMATEKIVITQ